MSRAALTRLEVRGALRRVGLKPLHVQPVEDWLAEDAPRWNWPSWRVRWRPFDREVDA